MVEKITSKKLADILNYFEQNHRDKIPIDEWLESKDDLLVNILDEAMKENEENIQRGD